MLTPVLVLALMLGAVDGGVAPGPLETARAHLEAGRLEEVLFAVEGAPFAEAEKEAAAGLLASAARASWKAGDRILALQFVQMSLRHVPAQPQALEVGARVALGEYQFEDAERLADAWVKASGRASAARLLRAQIALAQGEWQRSLELVEGLDAARLPVAEREVLQVVQATARAELDDRRQGLSTVRAFEARLVEAEVRARKLDARPEKAAARRGEIVLYGNSWCPYCKKARRFFEERNIPFVDRDLERDNGAERELADKARAAGVRPTGVPVIDVRGRLVLGFDQQALERALGK